MERKLFCSSNGFEFLECYLTKIYGERGSIKHNLERYIYGEFFQAGCRYVNTIDDLPEITFDEIKRLIEKENYFRTMSIERRKNMMN